MASVSRIDDVGVRIDEAGNDHAPRRVDADRIRLQIDGMGHRGGIADEDDAPLMSGDRRVVQDADLVLMPSTSRHSPGAGRDRCRAFDEKVGR